MCLGSRAPCPGRGIPVTAQGLRAVHSMEPTSGGGGGLL